MHPIHGPQHPARLPQYRISQLLGQDQTGRFNREPEPVPVRLKDRTCKQTGKNRLNLRKTATDRGRLEKPIGPAENRHRPRPELGAAIFKQNGVPVGFEPSPKAGSLPSDHEVACVLAEIYILLDVMQADYYLPSHPSERPPPAMAQYRVALSLCVC